VRGRQRLGFSETSALRGQSGAGRRGAHPLSRGSGNEPTSRAMAHFPQVLCYDWAAAARLGRLALALR